MYSLDPLKNKRLLLFVNTIYSDCACRFPCVNACAGGVHSVNFLCQVSIFVTALELAAFLTDFTELFQVLMDTNILHQTKIQCLLRSGFRTAWEKARLAVYLAQHALQHLNSPLSLVIRGLRKDALCVSHHTQHLEFSIYIQFDVEAWVDA